MNNVSQKDIIRYMLSLLNSLQYIMFNQKVQTNNFINVLNQLSKILKSTNRFSQDDIDKIFSVDTGKLNYSNNGRIARGIIHKIMDNLTQIYNQN